MTLHADNLVSSCSCHISCPIKTVSCDPTDRRNETAMPKQQSRVIILLQLLNSTFGLVELNPLAAALTPSSVGVFIAING